MSLSNESPILVAEVNRAEAKRLGRALKALSRTVRVAGSAERLIELLRKEVFHEGVVAVEVQIGKESALAYLSRLLAVRYLVGVGSADDASAEVRARAAGAQVYLPRPVTSEMLSGLSWMRNNRDCLCSSLADRPRCWVALARARSAGLDPASVRELGGRLVFSKEIDDTRQTSFFSPFSLPGL